jgi:hypothetical protein
MYHPASMCLRALGGLMKAEVAGKGRALIVGVLRASRMVNQSHVSSCPPLADSRMLKNRRAIIPKYSQRL